MKKIIGNNRGLSIVEMLVASVLLVIVAFGVQTVVTGLIKGGTKVEQKVSLQKIVRSLIYQISTRQQNQPGVIPDARFANSSFDPYADPEISTQTCYNKSGIEVGIADIGCFYTVRYFRLQILDTKFSATSDVAKIPLTRLQIKISYVDGKENKNLYLSQFQTSFLSQ
jgi:hypothetical protein